MMPASVPFVCLAFDDFHGYADIYLNRLYSMLERHCPLPFTLTCFAGMPRRPKYPIQMLPVSDLMPTPQTHPTYYKLGLFKSGATPFERFLYLDMSLVIRQDMTQLLEFAWSAPQDLVIVNEWSYAGYNSCVMAMDDGALQTVYDAYIEGTRYPLRVEGDQDFICEHLKARGLTDRVAFFPPTQIISYKRTRYLSEEGPQQMEQAKAMIAAATIIKFHGNPKMHHIAKRPRNIFKSLDSSLFKRELYENWR